MTSSVGALDPPERRSKLACGTAVRDVRGPAQRAVPTESIRGWSSAYGHDLFVTVAGL